jgi:ribosomal protein S18 acetylase RimI-like enzyme
MKNYKIEAITELYIDSYAAAFDSIAREGQFFAYQEGPPAKVCRDRIQESLSKNMPNFIALSDNKLIGWCEINAFQRPVFAHTGALVVGVIAGYRHQGIGEALMLAALEKAKAIGLERIQLHVREPNQTAILYYKKFGFVEEGMHPKAVRTSTGYENLISMGLLL